MFWVISSTASVAMPAARPDSRIKGIPTRKAKRPPATAAITSDQKFPTEWSRISPKTCGRILDFVGGIESSPAAYAPTRKNPIWPNEITPELPMKTYSATTIAAKTSACSNSIARAFERNVPQNPTSAISTTGPASWTRSDSYPLHRPVPAP